MNIDVLAMTFESEIVIELRWKDRRLIFKDLRQDGNFLNKSWKNQIWLPPLYFSNTDGNEPISRSDSNRVQILRQGPYKYNDPTELNEGTLFQGEENELHLQVRHQTTFKCLFHLSMYPFDIQHCSINLQMPRFLHNYTTLKPEEITYSGMYVIFRGGKIHVMPINQ